jgi:hypothetical protein
MACRARDARTGEPIDAYAAALRKGKALVFFTLSKRKGLSRPKLFCKKQIG